MLANIIFTLFETEKHEKLQKWVDENIPSECRTIGKHKDSNREHYHISLYNAKIPIVKDLRKKYNRMGLLEDVEIEERKNIKMTVYAEGDEKFDKQKCLAYPLKEYENFDDILHKDYIKGITDDELEHLRAYAHTRYCAIKHNKDRMQEKKEENTAKQQELDTYLKTYIYKFMCEYKGKPIDAMGLKDEYTEVAYSYMKIFAKACEFQQESGKLSWRWSDISNHIYSLMFRTKLWNPIAIIAFQQRIKY